MDSDLESKLLSLFTQPQYVIKVAFADEEAKMILSYIIIQIIHLINSMDLESQPKPVSEFMSLIIQMKYVFKSMDLDSQPKPLSKLISLFTQLLNPTNSDSVAPHVAELTGLIKETWDLEPEPEFISLIYQILSLVKCMTNSNYENLIFLCPQAVAKYGNHHMLYIDEGDQFRSKYNKWNCLFMKGENFRIAGEGASSYFFCRGCCGQKHEKATDEIKHPLHPKHSLRVVFLKKTHFSMLFPAAHKKRKCYCCDEYLYDFICCCLECDFAMNMACLEKPPVLSINHPKWHDHPLTLFSRTTSLICDVCALVVDSTSPIYICPPCGFVVHRKCLSLPRVIKISRHPYHRLSFTPSFSQGSLSCGVCRKRIHHDYGGYSCIKQGCYAAHSRCATQRNVWDGVDLEGVPDEIEEVLEPFETISDGIIRHFSHQHHHLRLDGNKDKYYDENKQCQACTTPIYVGNFYSCMQCDFILHEKCAELSRKIYHPIHPHKLTLVGECDGGNEYQNSCSICSLICTTGFFYNCSKEGCNFKVHVQCGTISEPLVHGSHMHPLFLTSKPFENRRCSICKDRGETFNCTECEFSLCFGCATIPEKVRYKHDKHMLFLSYGKETSTMASWCEVCEGKIDPEKWFYMCDEYCCVTLHVRCAIGKDLYMKLGSSWFGWRDGKLEVVANNMHMTRPFCSGCRKRCTQKIVLKMSGLIFCSLYCNSRRDY